MTRNADFFASNKLKKCK